MADDYIPARDADFSLWAQAFAAGITANPGTYMLTAAQALSIQTVVDAYVAALLVATTESTRTKVTIDEKNAARFAAKDLCRQYAILIKENDGIDPADKIAIGVRPVNTDREPIPCPQSPPLISVLGATQGAQTLVYADSNTPDSKAKPFGASELQLFVDITDDVTPPSVGNAKFVGKFTRNPVSVDFDAADAGKLATYYGRWASVRGETGLFSTGISFRIAA